ncbi:hypothetical protein GCM10011331_00530 [Flavimobilis marinus]|nr:hypothetical protein GCM10011331_00530 [Flavimobilis marinus]
MRIRWRRSGVPGRIRRRSRHAGVVGSRRARGARGAVAVRAAPETPVRTLARADARGAPDREVAPGALVRGAPARGALVRGADVREALDRGAAVRPADDRAACVRGAGVARPERTAVRAATEGPEAGRGDPLRPVPGAGCGRRRAPGAMLRGCSPPSGPVITSSPGWDRR